MKKLVPADSILIPNEAQRVFQGELFDVYQWPQPMFDGSNKSFEMLRRPDTVVVYGVVDGHFLTIQEQQANDSRARTAFPTGRVEPTDSSTLEAAKREMLEESGYEFTSWRLIGVTQPFNKLEWFVYVYLATEGQKVSDQALDPGEKIQIEFMDFDQVLQQSFDKNSYFRYVRDLATEAGSMENFLNAPEYQGQEIDR